MSVLEFPNPQRVGSVVKRTLSHNGYEADFYTDSKTQLVHYVITRQGESEIVMWGQEKSIEEAERRALEWMTQLGRKRSG